MGAWTVGRGRAALVASTAAVVVAGTAFLPVGAAPPEPVEITVLSISDWHAQLDPLDVFGEGVFGGAAQLSTYFQQERAAHPNTLTFTAGDAFGASPPLSNFFDEEPAVRSMRLMGFDADTFGNHNFDRGIQHLQDMIDIAGAPAGVEPGEPFQYVSANLRNVDANLSGVKPFEIFEVGGVKVAAIGITNPEAPELVFPGSFGTIRVTDPVAAANKARAQAARAGAKVFVALTHLGVTGFHEDGEAFGPLIDFAENVGGFDLILGDHTNQEFSGVINNALVVENRSKGRTYARMTLDVNPLNGTVIERSVDFVDPVSSAVTPDPAIVELLEPLREELREILGEVVGESTVFIPRADACGRSDGRLCESLVGNVVTDALRDAYGTDFALTNAGGLRAALTCPTTDDPNDFCPEHTGPNFDITLGQVLTVLPFGNTSATLTLDGALLKAFLENGVSAMPGANGRFAQVSGLCFTYDISASPGSRVQSAVRQADDGTCAGAPVDLTAGSSYTLATNDFVASGGDGYPDVSSRMVTRAVMDQDVADYVSANTPISPAIEGRIECTTTGVPACPAVTSP
jgi:2',3'-cyclic-nucleotide 2'-phosphodiesterase (5'-nucleotidase family)